MRSNSRKKIIASITTIAFICAAFIPTVHSQVGRIALPQVSQTTTNQNLVQETITNLLNRYEETIIKTSPPNNPFPLDSDPPTIHLPSGQVTMKVFSSTTSYFRTQLFNVPTGYEVSNGNYTGWCTDSAHTINTNTAYQVTLYSSYNPSLPTHLYHQNWSKVNYILNHKVGTDWHQVEYAILYILNFGNQGLNSNGWTMVNDAIAYGGSYIPDCGDIIAIIADVSPTVQRTIFEVIVPAYTLTVSINGEGSVDSDPEETSYTYAEEVQLTATSDPGWSFNHWGGDLSGSTNPTTIAMTGNKAVTATFTQCVYTLSVSVDPVAGGSVGVVPSAPYYYGTVVTLTAGANPGYSFDHWSGDVSGSDPVTTVTMTGDRSVTAHFSQDVYTLSVSVDPVAGGSVGVVPSAPYYYGTVVTLTAGANPGYSFDHWSGDVSGSDPVTTVTMTGDRSVTAHFSQDVYTLSVSVDPVAGGSVGVVPSAPYYYGTVVTLTAGANPGYSFDHWSGDVSGSDPVTTVTMTGDRSVTAHFSQDVYTLSVSVDPVAGGSVGVVPSAPYYYGTVVTLTAGANPGYSFDHWSGDVSGSDPVTTVTMTGDRSVTAHFSQDVYTLSVSVDPVAGGSVGVVPSAPYYYGTVVTLTAGANPGYSFDHWSGDVSGSDPVTTVTMTGDRSVTAHFSQDVYTLSVSVDPVAGGSVGVVPSAPYYYGTVVTLTAGANPGYSFDHWSGDVSGSNPVTTVTMTGDRSVTAHFSQNVYTLSVSVDPVAGGSVGVVPSAPYYYGTVVTLTAGANPGYSFDHWSGDVSGSNPVTTVTMTGDRSVTAHFSQNVYTLSVSVDPVAGGSVGVVPSAPYYYGTVVTLTAGANPGYSFDHWSGDASGSNPVTTVTMTGDRSVTAHFTQEGYTLTITIDGQGTVMKDPDQTTYAYNSIVELTAIADENWVFNSWSGDLSGNQNPQNITMNANKTVTAHFTYTGDDMIPPVVKIVKPGNNGIYIFNKLVIAFGMIPMPIIVQMITIEVNASDNESGIDHVEFFVDGVSKSIDDSAPYSYDWRDIISGKHTITVKAYDKAGNNATSPDLLVFKWRFHPMLVVLLMLLGLVWQNEKPTTTAATNQTSG